MTPSPPHRLTGEASHLTFAVIGGTLSSQYGRRTPPCVQRVFHFKAAAPT